MQVEIVMELRKCEICQSEYRVWEKSKQKRCSAMCEPGTPVRGARPRRLKVEKQKTESVFVSVGKATQAIDKKSDYNAQLGVWGTAKKRLKKTEKGCGGNMQETEREFSKEKEQEGWQNLKVLEQKQGETTLQTKSTGLSASTPPATEGTRLELSEDSQKKLEKGALASMNLLSASASRLHLLMQEAVKDLDLQKSDEGTQRVEAHRIEMAINCANAISQTIQTQVNLVKTIGAIMK